jgi:hypothetical protein
MLKKVFGYHRPHGRRFGTGDITWEGQRPGCHILLTILPRLPRVLLGMFPLDPHGICVKGPRNVIGYHCVDEQTACQANRKIAESEPMIICSTVISNRIFDLILVCCIRCMPHSRSSPKTASAICVIRLDASHHDRHAAAFKNVHSSARDMRHAQHGSPTSRQASRCAQRSQHRYCTRSICH